MMLIATTFILQYPFHLSYFNQVNDAKDYIQASKWLYESDHYASSTRPFLFPLLIGLPQIFGFEINEYFVAFLNVIFWLCTIGLLFSTIKGMAGEKSAFVLTLIFASCVSLHCFVFFVHTENIYTFILLAHISCLYQYFKTQNTKWFYGAVWLLGASVVVRPTLLYFVFVSFCILIALTILKKIPLKRLIIITLLLFSTVGVQMLNMYRCTGSLKVSYIGQTAWYLYFGAYSINLLKYPNQTIDFYAKKWEEEVSNRHEVNLSFINNRENFSKLPEVEKLINQDFSRQLKENKKGLVFTFFRSLFVNSRGGTQYVKSAINGFQIPYFSVYQRFFLSVSQIQNIVNSSTVLIFLPFIFAFQYKQLKNRLKEQFYVAVYAWFLALTLMIFSTVSFTQGDRFHVVTVPLTLFSIALIFFAKKSTFVADFEQKG